MKKIFFAFFIMLFISNVAFASESQNVWGHAWSDNIGWISFNCDNIRNGSNDCSGSDYGVNIKTGGCFEGHAWSDNLGWVSFNQADTGDAPTDETGDTTCLAQAYEDAGTTKIKGWARVLSGKDSDTDGFDGWIKFNGINIDTGINNNSPREFTGYAWGDVVNGWIQLSDNAKNFAVYTSYTSTLRPQPPTELNADLGSPCQHNLTFSWKYNPPLNTTIPQTCYEIEFSNGKTIKTEGSANSVSRNMLSSDLEFAYNQDYTFKVRTTADVDNKCNSADWSDWSSDFAFVSHPKYPEPQFTMNPIEHKLDELVELNNSSVCLGNCTWKWFFKKQSTEGGAYSDAVEKTDYVCMQEIDGELVNTPCNSQGKDLKIKFLNLYDYTISLNAKDGSLPSGRDECSTSTQDRPVYEEIKDIGPDDIDQFINTLNGSVGKVAGKFFSSVLKSWLGLDFWR